jgi:hypothetical protein
MGRPCAKVVTYRLGSCIVKHIRGNVNGFTLDLISPTAVVSQTTDNGVDVTAGVVDRLAIIKRFNSGEKLLVLLGQVGQLVQKVSPLTRRCVLPCGFECLSSSRYGEVDVLLGSFVDGSDDLFVRGVDDFELLLVDTLDPFAIDEPSVGESSLFEEGFLRKYP